MKEDVNVTVDLEIAAGVPIAKRWGGLLGGRGTIVEAEKTGLIPTDSNTSAN